METSAKMRMAEFFSMVREAVYPTANGDWEWYGLNRFVALIHGIQCAVAIGLTVGRLAYIMPDVPYVSGSQALRMTNHAMIRIDANDEQCSDVKNSPMFKQPFKKAFPSDLMNKERLYDFTNTFAVEYNMPGAHINTGALICVFFFLSCVFQIWNGEVLFHNSKTPRLITYFEYSLSSSLMIIVLGVNVGMFELYQLIGLFGLFFGMNMFGACAELLCYLAENAEEKMRNVTVLGVTIWDMWFIPHIAGWCLFLMAFVPILIKFAISCACSTPTMPWFVILAVCLEAVFFVAFGCVQIYFLWCRSGYALDGRLNKIATAVWWSDAWNIGLSFFAKTSLAWLLLGPALSVDVNIQS